MCLSSRFVLEGCRRRPPGNPRCTTASLTTPRSGGGSRRGICVCCRVHRGAGSTSDSMQTSIILLAGLPIVWTVDLAGERQAGGRTPHRWVGSGSRRRRPHPVRHARSQTRQQRLRGVLVCLSAQLVGVVTVVSRHRWIRRVNVNSVIKNAPTNLLDGA